MTFISTTDARQTSSRSGKWLYDGGSRFVKIELVYLGAKVHKYVTIYTLFYAIIWGSLPFPVCVMITDEII